MVNVFRCLRVASGKVSDKSCKEMSWTFSVPKFSSKNGQKVTEMLPAKNGQMPGALQSSKGVSSLALMSQGVALKSVLACFTLAWALSLFSNRLWGKISTQKNGGNGGNVLKPRKLTQTSFLSIEKNWSYLTEVCRWWILNDARFARKWNWNFALFLLFTQKCFSIIQNSVFLVTLWVQGGPMISPQLVH